MGIEKNPWQQAEVKQTEKLSCRDTAFLLKKVKRWNAFVFESKTVLYTLKYIQL